MRVVGEKQKVALIATLFTALLASVVLLGCLLDVRALQSALPGLTGPVPFSLGAQRP